MSSELRAQLVQAVELPVTSGVLQASGHGNMSARLDGERMLLTRRGGTLPGLTADDLVEVTFDGQALGGDLHFDAREIVGWHRGVYRERADVGAVVHPTRPTRRASPWRTSRCRAPTRRCSASASPTRSRSPAGAPRPSTWPTSSPNCARPRWSRPCCSATTASSPSPPTRWRRRGWWSS